MDVPKSPPPTSAFPVKRAFDRHRRMAESDPNSDILKCRQSNRRDRLKVFKHQFNVAGGPLNLSMGCVEACQRDGK